MHPTPRTPPRGFTLVELLVVVAIIGLISAVALPVVLPALNERRVSESARLLQAVLAGARDAAIRANAPRGIRLLPDPILNPDGPTPGVLAANRVVPIEPAPQYTEGMVNLLINPLATSLQPQLVAVEVLNTNYANNYVTPVNTNFPSVATITVPPGGTAAVLSNPTSWYWNIRQGDKIRFNDSGPYYTVAGPMKIGPHKNAGGLQNPERYINNGPPNYAYPRTSVEYLILVNGQDDDENGYVDDSFDGLDNNGDNIVDPLYNGIDDDGDGKIDNEFPSKSTDEGYSETEKFDGTLVGAVAAGTNLPYTIYRRPIVSPGARETTLPAGVVIDLTTWNAPTAAILKQAKDATLPTLQPERSRLPVDPYTYYVDIMISPNGQVVQSGAGSSGGDLNALAPGSSQPFYHFWLTEREGVVPPLWGINNAFTFGTEKDTLAIPNLNPNYGKATTSQNYLLPMPKGTTGYLPMTDDPATGGQKYSANPAFLTGERRLVTLFVKTGQIVSNSIESFNINDTSTPFYDAQAGIKESQ